MGNLIPKGNVHLMLWGIFSAIIVDRKDRHSYRSAISEFCNFLGVEPGSEESSKRLLQISQIEATLWKEELFKAPGIRPKHFKEKGVVHLASPATVRKKLMILRRLFKGLQEEGLIQKNPFSQVKLPKIHSRKRETELVPFEKVRDLIHAPGSEKDSSKVNSNRATRDRAILAALFLCGLRVGEVESLRMMDLKTNEEGISFFFLKETKVGVDQEQVIPPDALKLVELWKERRAREKPSSEDPFFCSISSRGDAQNSKKKISRGSINNWAKHYGELVGIDRESISSHCGRVTAVSYLLSKGLEHKRVKDFSRHSSIEMVDYYDRRFFGKKDSLAFDMDILEIRDRDVF